MDIIAIACYRPKPGKADVFRALLSAHQQLLREQELVSDRAPYRMRSANGTIIEVFAWRSEEAKAAAHANPALRECWQRFAELADMVPLASLEEAGAPFASFAAC